MSTKTNNFRIGLFVLAAVALFVVGLLAFGARSLFVQKRNFETAIEGAVYGLSVGSRVELRGVPIGKVTHIEFDWNVYPLSRGEYVIVEFEVDYDIAPSFRGDQRRAMVAAEVKKGLRASVKSQGVTGTSILALEYLDLEHNPPPPITYTPRNLYIPSAPGQFTRMLDAIQKSLHNLEELNFAEIGSGVTNTLRSTAQLMEKFNRIDLKTISTDITSLLVELRGAVVEIRETLKAMKLDTVGQNADQLLGSLRETSDKLQIVLDKVGAAPLQDTISDIREAVQTLNGVLLELKQYPSGFILGKPPLPAKSVQPSK
jgi:phospholipid/cholesterol/gamma-HCH transport system substrate-binding protein